MSAAALIDSLERFAGVIPAVVAGLSDADARWKPPDGAWSVLEVVTHLADEEAEDFRARLQHILSGADGPWPPIDPEGWAVQRRYNDGDLAEVTNRFIHERRASITWLRSITVPLAAGPRRGPGDLSAPENSSAPDHSRAPDPAGVARRLQPDWSAAYAHPQWGPIRAGDLLAAWAAHDALHLRQIAKRLYQLTAAAAGDHPTIYAGEWTA